MKLDTVLNFKLLLVFNTFLKAFEEFYTALFPPRCLHYTVWWV